MRMEDELGVEAMELSPLEKLALNCPRCFGPGRRSEEPDEPDVIVCYDCNFQQRRHEAASREYAGISIRIPSLFLDPGYVAEWEAGRQAISLVRETNEKWSFLELSKNEIYLLNSTSACRILVQLNTPQRPIEGVDQRGKDVKKLVLEGWSVDTIIPWLL